MFPRIVLCLVTFTLVSVGAFGATCSNSTLAGNYGFLVTGSTGGNPLVIHGQLALDSIGGITGSQTTSVNGAITSQAVVTGNYAINAKCTGTATLTPHVGTVANYSLVILASGEVEMVETDSGAVASGFAHAQGASTCSTPLRGVYGLQESGNIVGQGAVAFVGQVTLHGDGTLNGTRSGSVNGNISTDLISGAYKIGSNCFGGAVLSINRGSPTHFNLVVTQSGREILFIQTDQNTAVIGTFQQ